MQVDNSQYQGTAMIADLDRIVFVGLNGRVAALDRRTGATVWQWRSPKHRNGYVSLLLLDERQLIVSVDGYTYCLHPRTGQQEWVNELKGFGTGVTSIVALGRYNPHDVLVAAAAQTASRSSAASSGATTGT
jgi:outer membrane protein assembly factor BamB